MSDDDAIEAAERYDMARDELDTVRKQRDALAEALREIVGLHWIDPSCHGCTSCSTRRVARAALAALEQA